MTDAAISTAHHRVVLMEDCANPANPFYSNKSLTLCPDLQATPERHRARCRVPSPPVPVFAAARTSERLGDGKNYEPLDLSRARDSRRDIGVSLSFSPPCRLRASFTARAARPTAQQGTRSAERPPLLCYDFHIQMSATFSAASNPPPRPPPSPSPLFPF